MKQIPRDVIKDLLPLYIAGETSQETTGMIKKYLETDPELAEIAREMANENSLNKVPIPFRKDTALETYQEAKKWMTIRTLGIAFTIGMVMMCFFLVLLIGTSIDSLTHFITP